MCGEFREPSERNFFYPIFECLGDITEHCTIVIVAIMMSKRDIF